MRFGALLVFVVGVLAVSAGPASAKSGCNTVKCHERVAMKQCSQSRPVACIKRAALHYKMDFSLMKRVASCESRLIPTQVNGNSGATGLFQFLYSTWASTKYGYLGDQRKSAKWSSLAAAWLMKTDGIFHWNASRGCWG